MRTDIDSVKAVIETALENKEILKLITQANRVVTNVLGGEGLATDVLTDIETWFTAHLIAVAKERQPEEEKVGDVWLVYQEKPQEFLRSTSYGQFVSFLDTSGKMQQATKQKATIQAIKQVDD